MFELLPSAFPQDAVSAPERWAQVAGLEMAVPRQAGDRVGVCLLLGYISPSPSPVLAPTKGQPARISLASYVLQGSQPLFPELEPDRLSSSEAIKGENQHPNDLVYGAK